MMDTDSQMDGLVTGEGLFKRACPFPNTFSGRHPRWFCATNHLAHLLVTMQTMNDGPSSFQNVIAQCKLLRVQCIGWSEHVTQPRTHSLTMTGPISNTSKSRLDVIFMLCNVLNCSDQMRRKCRHET